MTTHGQDTWGVTKNYNRVLKHFFWPGLNSDVVQYIQGCQVVCKPNQAPAPLCPIPVTVEPFDKVIVDCVLKLRISFFGLSSVLPLGSQKLSPCGKLQLQ